MLIPARGEEFGEKGFVDCPELVAVVTPAFHLTFHEQFQQLLFGEGGDCALERFQAAGTGEFGFGECQDTDWEGEEMVVEKTL